MLLVLAFGLAGAFRLLTHGGGDHARRPARASEPAVLVLPLEAAGDDDSRLLASGLTGELIATLMRFDALQVFAGAPPDQGGAALPAAATGAPAYVVAGRVGREPGRIRVTARLTDRASGRVLWSGSYDRALTTGDIFDLEAELAASIAGHLAQPYGVIPEAAAKGLGEGRPGEPDRLRLRPAGARLPADLRQGALPAGAVLPRGGRRERAGLRRRLGAARLRPPGRRALRAGRAGREAGEMAAGVEAALRAVALAPDRVRPWQALAALRFASGDYDEAERVQRRAIALNPDNPESLAQLGWRLVARGRWDEGATYLQDAIDRSVRVPAWYYEHPRVRLVPQGRCRAGARRRRARQGGLLRDRLRGAGDRRGRGRASGGGAGRPRRGRAAGARPGARPAGVLGQAQASDEVIDRLDAGLALAGLEAARSATRGPASP